MDNLFFAPKGGMCARCTKQGLDCSSLDFKSMPAISKPFMFEGKNTVTVKCSDFEKSTEQKEKQ